MAATSIHSLVAKGELFGWACYSNLTIIETTNTTLCGAATARQAEGTGVGVRDIGLDKSQLSYPLSVSDSAVIDPPVQGRGWTGITCDSTGRLVTGINLQGWGLTGRIPDTIGYLENLTALNLADNYLTGTGLHHPALVTLTHLTSLQLQNNQLTGRISTRIGLLTNLLNLGLHNNAFSGSIPTSIGLLTKLTALDLHSNRLSRNVPSQLFFLTGLTKLDLSLNRFYGSFPQSMQNMPSLTWLDAHSAYLRGSVPAIWGTAMPKLAYLDLSNNGITNSLPSSLGLLTRLRYLKLNSNSLAHTLPSAVGLLTQLLDMSLEFNAFTGQIPSSLGNLSAAYSITVDNNRLSRTIPSTLTALTRLMTFTLNNNKLSGSIPSNWGSPHLLHALQTFALNDNSLSRCVPSSLGYLTNLASLQMQNNILSCALPSFAFLNQRKLKLLNFENNRITSTLPVSMGNMTSLTFLYGRLNTKLGGALPQGLLGGHARQLQVLDLSSCNFSSTIPATIAALASLYSFDVHSNRILGSLPSYAPRGSFIASYNELSGGIPAAFLSAAALNYLALEHNSLSGSVPDISMQWLNHLSLNNNLLSGRLTATSFAACYNMARVYINNNLLTGPLPAGLCTSANLRELELSNNKLTSFPSTALAGNCQYSLQALDVSHNRLASPVPPALFACSSLRYVDLSYNRLHGRIDALLDVEQGSINRAVYNYLKSSLLTLHMEHNLLSGSLPALFYELTSLQGVWMHVNNVTGPLSSDVSKMQQLQTLSLYSNSFTNALPSQLAIVTNLVTLDLHANSFNSTLAALLPLSAGLLKLTTLDVSQNSIVGTLPTRLGALTALTRLSVEQNYFTGQVPTQLAFLNALQTLSLGRNNYTTGLHVSDVTSSAADSAKWLVILLNKHVLRSLSLEAARVRGSMAPALLASATKLTYLNVADNAITGAFPPTAGLGLQLQTLDVSGNLLTFVPSDLCSIASLQQVELFAGNAGLGCYPECLRPLMGTFITAVPSCSAMPSGQPTGQPSLQPSMQPSMQPSGQPSRQPTSEPSHVHYDGLFVQLVPYVPPISTLSDQGQCTGSLELYNSSSTETSSLGELWCVQYKSGLRFRYFGLPELKSSVASRNHSLFVRAGEVSAGLNLSAGATAVQTLVVRGKGSEWWLHHKSQLSSALPVLSAQQQAVQPTWEDTLLACPHFGAQAYGDKSNLPVARHDAWAYGQTAMIQKVLVEPSAGMVINSTNIVGAILVQKGGLAGGAGHVQIYAAKSDWHESNLTCAATVASKLLPACTGLSTTAAPTDANPNLNLTLRSIARHVPVAWTLADVTELVQCQLHQLELSSPPHLHPASMDAFHLSFLWQPVARADDVHYYLAHYPYRAAGDAPGDADRVFNQSSGLTEWLSSESNDAPFLLLYFR